VLEAAVSLLSVTVPEVGVVDGGDGLAAPGARLTWLEGGGEVGA
jgi:hypothetical protein